jgi:general secretion pathway protein J
MSRRDHSSLERAAAFTLVELLVAMAILAIVTVLAWRGLDQVSRGRDAIVGFLGEERAMTQFFDQLRYDADSVVNDSDLNDPPVQIAADELRLVRHFYQPGTAPRLQVVRYRLEGDHLLRYASLPLATLGAVHTTLDASLEAGERWSVVALAEPVSAAQLRVWVPGTGWTDREDDLVAAAEAGRTVTNLSAGVSTPATRTVTGLQIQIQAVAMRNPMTRVVLVGG